MGAVTAISFGAAINSVAFIGRCLPLPPALLMATTAALFAFSYSISMYNYGSASTLIEPSMSKTTQYSTFTSNKHAQVIYRTVTFFKLLGYNQTKILYQICVNVVFYIGHTVCMCVNNYVCQVFFSRLFMLNSLLENGTV